MFLAQEREVRMATIGLVAATRVALGAGIGLLVAEHLSDDGRRAAGWALVAVGALTTIPLVAEILGSDSASAAARTGEPSSASRQPAFSR
jgi:hypothetical protein